MALEELKLTVLKNGVQTAVPALHSGWAENKKFLCYAAPPEPRDDGSFAVGVVENWRVKMEILHTDMEYLLQLSHHEFWSTMTFKQDAMNMVTSFLQYAHPHYMMHEFPDNDKMWEMFQSIHYLVLCILKRLATLKESKECYLSENKFAELVYDHHLFTVPMLLDVCLLYGREYRSVVTDIVTTVLDLQPWYLEHDLAEFTKILFKCMRYVQKKLVPENESLSECNYSVSLVEFRENLTTLLDMIVPLESFIDIYPPACKIFHESSFELKLSSFYNTVIPKMTYDLEALRVEDNIQQEHELLQLKLIEARKYLLRTYRHILSWCLNSAIEAGPDGGRGLADDYMTVLTETLSEKVFVRDYHSNFPVDQDLEMLSQISQEVEERSHYLIEAVLTNFDVPSKKQRKVPSSRMVNHELAENSAVGSSSITNTAAAAEVKDVLPHLEDVFIQKCLNHYQNDSQAVIHAILENTLPESLQMCGFLENSTVEQALLEEDDTLPQRRNVFDNDELDILRRDDIDMSKIHKGKKKSKHKNLIEMLNDKSHVSELKFKGLYDSLGNTDLYEDEYDDTYDNLEIAVDDSEEVERRPIVVPRVLQTKANVRETPVSESESEEEQEPVKSRDIFVPNPEEVRAKRNQFYNSSRGKANVAGRPKGQGQEKDVTRNRDKKTVHKSTRGNHNRRGGAQWKRSQGMIPS